MLQARIKTENLSFFHLYFGLICKLQAKIIIRLLKNIVIFVGWFISADEANY